MQQQQQKNHNQKLLHRAFHFPNILDNSSVACSSVREADFPAQTEMVAGNKKQIVAVDRWNEKWVVSLMLRRLRRTQIKVCTDF